MAPTRMVFDRRLPRSRGPLHPVPRAPATKWGSAVLLLLPALALPLTGCDDGLERRARRELALGRLDVAEALADRLPAEHAAEVREAVAAARAHRAEVAREVESLLSSLGERHFTELRDEMRALLADERDVAARESIERALSELDDRRAFDARGSARRTVPAPADRAAGEHAPEAAAEIPLEIREAHAGPADAAEAQDEPEEDPERAARAHEARGDLPRAVEAWRTAARRAPEGPGRERHLERARDLEARLALHEELAAAARTFGARAGAQADLGVTDVDVDGLVLHGQQRSWRAVPPATLLGLAERLELSPFAEVGLLGLVLETGDEDERKLARARLRDAVAGGRIGLERAEALMSAEVRAPRSVEAVVREQRLAARAAELVEAGVERRDELLEHLLAEGAGAEAAGALRARWSRAVDVLQAGDTLARLSTLAEARRALDAARAAALELILDEQEYFYPYRPPACPPVRAAGYGPVQRRVEDLVRAVREAWVDTFVVELPAAFRAGLAELDWIRASSRRGPSVELPEGTLPAWIRGAPRDAGTVDVRTFAWDEAERLALRRSAAIRAYNRRMWQWAESLDDPFRKPRWAEQRQVQVTNDYRAMFGRTALAWSPLLQESARIHALYMARTGDFGHVQDDPELETPRMRMAHVGYPVPGTENCARGTTDPMGAHRDWTGSSGHHRNLLAPGYTEMASALESSYWAQNFGRDETFAEELEAWSD